MYEVRGFAPLLLKTREFLRQRAGKTKTKKLRDLRPNAGYEEREEAWEDRFFEPYAGKDYGGRATEVLTMGLEMLFFPSGQRNLWRTRELGRADAEMRRFILGLLAAV